MKGGLTAIISAIKALKDSGFKPNGDVLFAGVSDEEYASIGAEELVKEYKADAVMLCEPSSMDIRIAHKGFAWIKIAVHGKAAHGSKPELGVDAIVKVGKVLVEVEKLGVSLKRKQHALLGSPSIHASLIKGGIELSTYPDLCEIQLERRTIPGEDRDTVNSEMRELLAGIRGEDKDFCADYDLFFYRPHLEISRTEPIVVTLDKSFRRIMNKEPQYVGASGWMDSAIFAQAGIPSVIFGTVGVGNHAALEYVEFDSVIKTAEILAGVVVEFCG
jgi:acetylornithine deacetylase